MEHTEPPRGTKHPLPAGNEDVDGPGPTPPGERKARFPKGKKAKYLDPVPPPPPARTSTACRTSSLRRRGVRCTATAGTGRTCSRAPPQTSGASKCATRTAHTLLTIVFR